MCDESLWLDENEKVEMMCLVGWKQLDNVG